MRPALNVVALAALLLGATAAPALNARRNSTPTPLWNDTTALKLHKQSYKFREHNVSTTQVLAAEYLNGTYVPLTDPQADAIIAANEAPYAIKATNSQAAAYESPMKKWKKHFSHAKAIKNAWCWRTGTPAPLR